MMMTKSLQNGFHSSTCLQIAFARTKSNFGPSSSVNDDRISVPKVLCKVHMPPNFEICSHTPSFHAQYANILFQLKAFDMTERKNLSDSERKPVRSQDQTFVGNFYLSIFVLDLFLHQWSFIKACILLMSICNGLFASFYAHSMCDCNWVKLTSRITYYTQP